jgi:MFS family permease
MPSVAATPPRLTLIQWLICIIAAIGFAFDTYVLLMLPLIIKDAIETLGPYKFGTPEYTQWARLLFFVPAFVGGAFGLLGGYLTDRLGRRRVLTWSILIYAFSACGAAFSTSLAMLLVLRCAMFLGVCVEFVAAVAWLAELFPDPLQRENVLGYTQAFSSLGGLMVSGVYVLISLWRDRLPAIESGHESWRYLSLSGVIPALPLIVIRPFLPESPQWQQKKQAGTLKRPSFLELFKPEFRRTTFVTTIMFACSFGAAFGAIQHLPQIVPGLPEVRDLPKPEQSTVVGHVQLIQEIGGLVGRVLLAILAVRIVSRRALMRVFQVPGLIVVPLVFFYAAVHSLGALKFGIFFAGLLTVAQFSFWGNYLPRVYPLHLRGTGESFAANVGGRILGTSAAWIALTVASSQWLKDVLPDTTPFTRFSFTAAGVGLAVYAVGSIACFFLPEPKRELPQD